MMVVCITKTKKAESEARMITVLERERWVLMKIPRCDTDGVGEVK